jgi:hypothetical protein
MRIDENIKSNSIRLIIIRLSTKSKKKARFFSKTKENQKKERIVFFLKINFFKI